MFCLGKKISLDKFKKIDCKNNIYIFNELPVFNVRNVAPGGK